MYKTFLVLIATLLTTLFVGSSRAEIVPFPWGKEIPIPWKHMEGNWNVQETGKAYGYQINFNIIQEHQDGTRVVQVTIYDNHGQIRAKGLGVSGRSDNKVVRAIMSSTDGEKYLLFIRAVKQLNEKAGQCRIVIVITERPMELSKPARDVHHVINRPDMPGCSAIEKDIEKI